MDLSTSHPAHCADNLLCSIRRILECAGEVQKNLDEEWLYAARQRDIYLRWNLLDSADGWAGVMEDVLVAGTFLEAARTLAFARLIAPNEERTS